MKLQLCYFSGMKIHPGRGKTHIRIDGKSFTFLSSKCERSHFLKRNPREVRWTVLYRRKHRKGMEEDVTKKRTRKTHKFQRAIVGASITDIMAKRNMKPEVRKAQREQIIRAAKEKKLAKLAKKAPPHVAKAPAPKVKKSQKMARPMPKSARPGHSGGKR